MKLKMTAIAAGLLVISGGAVNAAEVLNVSQMDTVTAAGYDYKYSKYFDGKYFKGRDGRGYWFGKWFWKGQWWNCKVKDEYGREQYARADFKAKPEKPDTKTPATTTTTQQNVTVNFYGDITVDNGSTFAVNVNTNMGNNNNIDVKQEINPTINTTTTNNTRYTAYTSGSWKYR